MYREVSLYLGAVQDVMVVPPGDDDVPAVGWSPLRLRGRLTGLLLISLEQFIDSLIGMTNMGFQKFLAICNTMAERKHSCGR